MVIFYVQGRRKSFICLFRKISNNPISDSCKRSNNSISWFQRSHARRRWMPKQHNLILPSDNSLRLRPNIFGPNILQLWTEYKKMKTHFILRKTKYPNIITQVKHNENTTKTNLPSENSLRLGKISFDQISSSYGQKKIKMQFTL